MLKGGCLSAEQSVLGRQQLTNINIRSGLLCTPEVTENMSNKILHNSIGIPTESSCPSPLDKQWGLTR
jgi:hypothetical protein